MPLLEPATDEALVNTKTSGSQRFSVIEDLANGNYVVVWTDYDGPSNSPYAIRLKAQLFASDGTPLGAEIPVYSAVHIQDDYKVDVLGLSDGSFLVTLIDGAKVTLTQIAANGTLLATIPVNPPAGLTAIIVADSTETLGGGWVTSWQETLSGNTIIRAQSFDSAGNKIGGPVQLVTGAAAQNNDLTTLANGNYLVTYVTGTSNLDVYGRIFDAALQPIGPAFALATSTTGAQIRPVSTALAGGNFVSVWQDNGSGAIRGQLFDAGGNRVGSEFLISTSISAAFPDVVALGDGGFVVAFDALSDAYLQVFDSTGARVGSETLINRTTSSTQGEPDLAVLADGRVAVSWNDSSGLGGDNSFHAVMQRLFGSVSGPTAGDDFITGTSGADTLNGLGGNDTLDGAAGADTMTGGTGNDIYYVDNVGDVVTELAGEGFDEVRTALSSIVVPANVERVTFIDAAANQRGSVGNDDFVGGARSDFFDLRDGGDDTVAGGDGADAFYFGSTLNAGDSVDGGIGGTDQLGLQGNYGSGGLGGTPYVFTAANMAHIELLALLAGNDTRFGDNAGNSYSYHLETVDANVDANRNLEVSFNTLRVGENVTFDGSAETDGTFTTYGGFGNDVITGGQRNDGFFFGVGRWGAGDSVDGQGGTLDQLALQGPYTGASAITFGANQITNIEMIVLITGGNVKWGSGGAGYGYDLTMNDGNVAAGALMQIQANTLAFYEHMRFDGSAETDGRFTVYSGAGNDTIIGGAGADTLMGLGGTDMLRGGLGADVLRGGSDNDVFDYDSVLDSYAGSMDLIYDFSAGDRIDLSTIDADNTLGGDQAFTFIGAAAFTAAGQVRAVGGGTTWMVQADVDGDGTADLTIAVEHPFTSFTLTGASFIL